jgi:hypothetical protein
MRKIILPLLLTCLLASCDASPQAVVVPTASVSPIPPTSTPLPSKTRVTIITATPTLLPKIATVEGVQESCDGSYGWSSQNRISPNGEWVVVLCHDDGDYTKVARLDGGRAWKLPAESYKDEYGNYSNPEYYWFYRWSVNPNYLYLSKYACCIDSPELIFVEAFGLYRLNLTSGVVEAIYDGAYFSLSPSEKYFVSVDFESVPRVNIFNRRTGGKLAYDLEPKYVDIGHFSWSPDESKLVFVGGLTDWVISDAQGFSLFSYDFHTHSLNVLINDDAARLIPADYEYPHVWLDEDTIILTEFYRGSFWKMNVQTGEREPYGEPTPTPTP